MFVTILFVAIFLAFPFLENYFTDNYVDITVLEERNAFGFGRFKFNILFTVFLNLMVAIFTIFFLSKIRINQRWLFKITAVLLNLTLFVWINYHIAEFIFFPFGYISIINTILILLLFYFYWNFIFKVKSIKKS